VRASTASLRIVTKPGPCIIVLPVPFLRAPAMEAMENCRQRGQQRVDVGPLEMLRIDGVLLQIAGRGSRVGTARTMTTTTTCRRRRRR
jgi:hypothetical protein